MASPNGPGISSVVPHARTAAPMKATAGSTRGMFQPESITSSLAATPAPSEPQAPLSASETAPPQHRIPRWLVRLELFLRVMLRMYIGLAICYAPWSHALWDQNLIFTQFPTLSIYAANGAVRGIVSGLGLLNLWIAFHDALRQRDR
jgi:hypothetical protein